MLASDIEARVRDLEQDTVKHTILLDHLLARMDTVQEKDTWLSRMVIGLIVGTLVFPAVITILSIYFKNL